MTKNMNITDILSQIEENIQGDELEISEVVEALEHRGYGPLLLAASLFIILPTGGIPGVPTICAVVILFLSVQLLAGKKQPWVPQILAKKSIDKEKFQKIRKKSEPVTSKIDKIIKPRLSFLTEENANRCIALICCIIALTLPPLELVPFAAMIPGVVIAFFALALSAKDGLFVVLGSIFLLLGLGFGVYSYL